MIERATLKDVKKAWDYFNALPVPFTSTEARGGSPPKIDRDRAEAWKEYTKVRDLYMYGCGALTLGQYNEKWCPDASRSLQKQSLII